MTVRQSAPPGAALCRSWQAASPGRRSAARTPPGAAARAPTAGGTSRPRPPARRASLPAAGIPAQGPPPRSLRNLHVPTVHAASVSTSRIAHHGPGDSDLFSQHDWTVTSKFFEMVLTSARLRLRIREILCEDHADVPGRALRLNMQGAWAVNRHPDMHGPGARGTPGVSLTAGAQQPAGRLASNGCEAAGELFTACYPRLAGWVRRLVDSDEDAHDIAAEAFARLLSRWSRVGNPHGYLYMIAANLVSDHWRKAGREQRAISKLTGAVGACYHQAQEVDVRALIEALPPRLRTAFLLHHYAGFEVRQIAAMTGRPEGTIKADLHHARRRLKTALTDTGGNPAPG